ncbi:MAG: tyrosine-type recombinase/integrase [Planctomycetia bacterium]
MERATKLAAELLDGTFRAPPPPAAARQAVDDYVAYLETEGRARKTIVKYRGVLDLFLKYLESCRVVRLAQTTAGHFDRYRAARRKIRHRKTVYCEGVIVKQFFKWARSRKMIVDDPLVDVRLEKPPLEPKEGPSLAQVDALLEAAEEPLRRRLAVLAFTGMRSGELQRLRPQDVDLVGGWIHILSRPGAETKTRQSRKVPIHARLRAVLEALPRTPRPYLFTAEPSPKYPTGGRPMNTKRLNDQFVRLATRLKLPTGREAGLVIHSLRHFVETFTVNAGIPQRVIDAWLGHRSDKGMAVVYYRLRDEDSQAFMAKVPF